MSFFTSCWLLPQNEQYSSFSPLEDFFSDMGQLWLVLRYQLLQASRLDDVREAAHTPMLPEMKAKRPNDEAPGRFLAIPVGASQRALSTFPRHGLHQARLANTLSIKPYSADSSADMKRSRSVSLAICSTVWPVRSARMPFKRERRYKISRA